jgi:hypothetical protein
LQDLGIRFMENRFCTWKNIDKSKKLGRLSPNLAKPKNVDKNNLCEKIAEKELKEQLKIDEYNFNKEGKYIDDENI